MWKRLSWRRFNRTTVGLLGCVGFLVGLGLARRQFSPNIVVVIAVTIVAAVTVWRWRSKLPTVFAVLVLGVVVGGWRGAAYLQALQPYKTLGLQKVVLTGTSTIDAVYGVNTQLSFVIRDVTVAKPYYQKMPGTIKVQGFGPAMIYRGDKVQVSGKLYPTRGANQASIGFADLQVVGGGSSALDNVRRKFTAGMQTALPEPVASFGLGLLVGQRNTLPTDISQTLLMVGLTHIIAVSGYNLTILLDASKRLMGGRSKVLSTALALALIAGFLLVAGTSASIVRAAVISVLGLAAWYYGRSIKPLLLIMLAGAVTAYANPSYVWSDISWWLSFLAFFGVLVMAPAICRRIFGEKKPHMLVQIAVESLCAELMTLPFVLYIFGQFSLVSLLANLLIAALIPLAMLLCLVAGLAGMLVGVVAGWFAWPANVLLTYMLDVAGLLSRIPHVFQQNRYLSVADMMICYTVLMALLWMLLRKQRLKQSWQAIFKQLRPFSAAQDKSKLAIPE